MTSRHPAVRRGRTIDKPRPIPFTIASPGLIVEQYTRVSPLLCIGLFPQQFPQHIGDETRGDAAYFTIQDIPPVF